MVLRYYFSVLRTNRILMMRGKALPCLLWNKPQEKGRMLLIMLRIFPTSFDIGHIVKKAQLVVDTRNAVKDVHIEDGKVFKL